MVAAFLIRGRAAWICRRASVRIEVRTLPRRSPGLTLLDGLDSYSALLRSRRAHSAALQVVGGRGFKSLWERWPLVPDVDDGGRLSGLAVNPSKRGTGTSLFDAGRLKSRNSHDRYPQDFPTSGPRQNAATTGSSTPRMMGGAGR